MRHTRILFTDLDGSLLDHDTYLPGPAAGALDEVLAAGIWVFFCSAKTLLEQADLADRLGCDVGFISENGSMAVLPGGAGRNRFGASYAEIRRALAIVVEETGIDVIGYGDMTADQVAEVTGLDADQADLARRRCCSETLIDLSDFDADELGRHLTHHGLRLQRGARFWTVQGEHDKGTAISWVIDQMSNDPAVVTTFGIGDGPNDEAMLRHVDHAVLLKGHDGAWAQVEVDGLVRIDGAGPEGWVEASRVLLEVRH